MPSFAEILRYFYGVGLMMAGRSEGLKHLDVSADGFWSSFAAIIVALPPVALSWVEYETVERAAPLPETEPVAIYAAHALADVAAWLLPVVILMLLARRIGYSRKIVPLVIATNWGTALLAWVVAPYWILAMLTGGAEIMALVGILVTAATLILTVRLTALSIGRDFAAALAIVALMVVSSLISYGVVMDVTGIPLV